MGAGVAMSTLLRGLLVLHPRIVRVRADALPAATRALLDAPDDSFALELPFRRTPAQLVSAAMITLLDRFTQPTSIVDAVLAESRASGKDAETLLEEVLAALMSFVRSGVLIDPGRDAGAQAADTPEEDLLLQAGSVVAGVTIERCVYRFEDSAVCRGLNAAGQTVAIKIFAPGDPQSRRRFANEARILALLDGGGAPRLHSTEHVSGRDVLLMEWREGATAADARVLWGRSLERRLAVARNIVAAYAALHERGVHHYDVHPNNILIDADDSVTLIDFALSRLVPEADDFPAEPLGVIAYTDPETAAALHAGRPRPPFTAATEQYRVAAVARYLLAGGAAHVAMGAYPDTALEVLSRAVPRSLLEDGIAPLPGVEVVLGRALALQPEDRFPDMRAFRDALAEAPAPRDVPLPSALAAASRERIDTMLSTADAGGAWARKGFPEAPEASLSHGVAGLAAGLLRLAYLRDDARALAVADLWVQRALPIAALAGTTGAVDRSSFDDCSLFHGAPGVHLVDAMVGHALRDDARFHHAAATFITSCDTPWTRPDLVTGRGGVLLGCALLYEATASADVAGLGDRVLDELWGDGSKPARATFEDFNLGMAHGLAGLLYTTLRWHRARGTPLPAAFSERVDQLAAAALPSGRALRWPWGKSGDSKPVFMPGWCNGDAGQVFLWALLAEHHDEPRFLRIAERAGWGAWSSPQGYAHLCCGAAGPAYAMLRLHAMTGDSDWLHRAHALTSKAIDLLPGDEPQPASLWRGDVGVLVLLADLEEPLAARLPLFEEMSWPVKTRETAGGLGGR